MLLLSIRLKHLFARRHGYEGRVLVCTWTLACRPDAAALVVRTASTVTAMRCDTKRRSYVSSQTQHEIASACWPGHQLTRANISFLSILHHHTHEQGPQKGVWAPQEMVKRLTIHVPCSSASQQPTSPSLAFQWAGTRTSRRACTMAGPAFRLQLPRATSPLSTLWS